MLFEDKKMESIYGEYGGKGYYMYIKSLETTRINSLLNTDTGVHISWDYVKRADAYRIYRKTRWSMVMYSNKCKRNMFTDTTAGNGEKLLLF